jgi:hypothetical protein
MTQGRPTRHHQAVRRRGPRLRHFQAVAAAAAVVVAATAIAAGASATSSAAGARASVPSKATVARLVLHALYARLPPYAEGRGRYATAMPDGSLLFGQPKQWTGRISCTRLTSVLFKCAWYIHDSALGEYKGFARVRYYKYAPDVVFSNSTCVSNFPGQPGDICAKYPAPSG